MWNLWHGCHHKLSAGCAHCYVYRGDEKRGVDSAVVTKTKSFDAPVARKKRDGAWKIPAGTLVYTCFTSDFFLEDADPWRVEAWDMIRERTDLRFFMITKRIDRFADCAPPDWGDGWEHVTICYTVENPDRADYRLPIFRAAPIRHKRIICEPLLERIDLRPHAIGEWAEQVVAGGESGPEARECDFDWVLALRDECERQGVAFWFKQTGARFVRDGRLYTIPRRLQHSQARKGGNKFVATFATVNLLEISEARRQEALRVVRESCVVEAWESVGATVNLVGSVRSGLIMNNLDIDFHVYTDEPMLARSEAAIARLWEVRDVRFRNLLDTEEECLEWHAAFDTAEGETWQLDMIHIRRGSAFDGVIERTTDAIIARLTPETREAILHIKHDAPEKVAGIEVYYAVLELGLRTCEEFAAWHRTHPAMDLRRWTP